MLVPDVPVQRQIVSLHWVVHWPHAAGSKLSPTLIYALCPTEVPLKPHTTLTRPRCGALIVSVINMVMATGLAVDYCVYFAQKFMAVHADGTGDQRMIAAMGDTGSAVFLGGLTALCGSVPMAFSKSIIIRTFFKLIFGTILFSLLVGLLLMPVLFSLLRPPPIKSVLVFESEPEHKATQHDAEVGMAPIADK
ncbi:sterol sensing 5-transmembrane protein [Haematococcus lacustris]|uniref:Sterol sensing 5-transmembrane protein n=1 Tax=Haematococcus lacustris TaxID=44745 RepID=A0A699YRJ0_HAELA|nr:sterol sensing 5-transmembrane protein [Haematococcus lacustris]